MHALIIEDEYMIATVIEFVLRECGFTSFDIAASCEAAIEAAKKRRPDLITADMSLDSGTGMEAVDVISPQESIPVISSPAARHRSATGSAGTRCSTSRSRRRR